MRIGQSAVPVCAPVRGACEILGLDPIYVANEGRFVAVVPEAIAHQVLQELISFDASATIIGTVETRSESGALTLETLGGTQALDLLTGEQLPRIC